MAGRASQTGFVGSVAVHAGRHGNAHFARQPIALGHRPVAGFASGAGVHVRLVTERDVAWYLVDANLRTGRPRKRGEFLSDRAIRLDGTVTHAHGCFRNPHHFAWIGHAVPLFASKPERQMLPVAYGTGCTGASAAASSNTSSRTITGV